MLINQQIQSKNVKNPYEFLPSVSTDELVSLMRIDKTVGTDRIAEYITNAYDQTNGDLPTRMKLPDFLQTLPSIDKDFWLRTYKKAVTHEAAAQFVDNHPDYDTTGNGIIRGDNEQSKSDKLRRIYHHAIADMTKQTRNRIRLL